MCAESGFSVCATFSVSSVVSGGRTVIGVAMMVVTTLSQAASTRRLRPMPRYEYRCRTCDESFELRRSMADAGEPAPCTQGHLDSVRLLSVFASVGAASGSSAAPAPSAPRTGGGCGSGCGCAH
jgi:putative FmdB family regulatory protein